MAQLDVVGINTSTGRNQRSSTTDIITGAGYFIGGTQVVVNPTAPNAADDTNINTAFLTIQGAVNQCPQYGTVLIAQGDYAEDVTLDGDIALVGMTNQQFTGWNAGYAYNSGKILIPSTATGSYFLFQNLYLTNNNGANPTVQYDKLAYVSLINSTVYNDSATAGAHAVHKTAGAGGLLYVLSCDISASGSNKALKTDASTSVSVLNNSQLNSAYDIAGDLVAYDSTFIGGSIKASGNHEFKNCKWFYYDNSGSYLTADDTDKIEFSNCMFYGQAPYLVNSTAVTPVYTTHIENSNINGLPVSTFKGVTGSAELYKLDTNHEVIHNRVISINAASTGTTNLMRVVNLSGIRFQPTKVILRLASATGLTGTLVAGVGVAAGEDDIFNSTTLTGFNTVDDTWVFHMDGKSKLIGPNSVIKLGIDTAFGGTVTIDAEIWGYMRT